MLPVKHIEYTFVEGGTYDGAQVVRVTMGGESPLSVSDLLALINENLPTFPLVEFIIRDWTPIDDDSFLTLCASLRDSETRIILEVPETVVKPVFAMASYVRIPLTGNPWPCFRAHELVFDFNTSSGEPPVGKANETSAWLYLHVPSVSAVSKDVIRWLKSAHAQWRLLSSRGTISASLMESDT